jgi:hypothetical protein
VNKTVREEYQFNISNRLPALENLGNDEDDVDINRVWKSITESIKFHPQNIYVIIGLKSIKHGWMKNVKIQTLSTHRTKYCCMLENSHVCKMQKFYLKHYSIR